MLQRVEANARTMPGVANFPVPLISSHFAVWLKCKIDNVCLRSLLWLCFIFKFVVYPFKENALWKCIFHKCSSLRNSVLIQNSGKRKELGILEQVVAKNSFSRA